MCSHESPTALLLFLYPSSIALRQPPTRSDSTAPPKPPPIIPGPRGLELSATGVRFGPG